MKLIEIFGCAGMLAPYSLADEWDNSGLLVEPEIDDISKVLLALDITTEVVREAHELGAQLIISHHPVIFDGLKTLERDTAPYMLVKYGIGALCLHTNLDRSDFGVNKALAKALDLKGGIFNPHNYLIVGRAPREMTSDEFAVYVKEKLGAPSVRYTQGSGKVTNVGVSSGAGGDALRFYKEEGFDAFVTGELKHHQMIFAQEKGIAVFDAGHFSTENVVLDKMYDFMAKDLPEVEFVISEVCRCPYKSI